MRDHRTAIWEVIFVSSDPDEIHTRKAYPHDDAKDVAQDATEQHDSDCAMELDERTEIKVRKRGEEEWAAFEVVREYCPSYVARARKP